MNPLILVAPPRELTRRPTGDPPGGPPGDFGPALARAQAPGPKSRNDVARTASAEGATKQAKAQTELEKSDAQKRDVQPGTANAAESASTPDEDGALAEAASPETAPVTATPASDQPIAGGEKPQAGVQSGELETGPLDAGQSGVQDDALAVAIKAPPGSAATDPTAVAAGSVPTEAAAAGAAPTTTDGVPATTGSVAATTAAPAATNASLDPSSPQATAPPEPAAGTGVQTEGQTATPAATLGDGGDPGREQSAPGSRRHLDAAAAVSPAQPQVATTEPQAATTGAQAPAPEADEQGQPQPTVASSTVAPGTGAPVAKPDLAAGELQVQPQPGTATTGQTLGLDRPVSDAPVRAHSQLAQLADTARTVVRMAVRDGAAQAHITLHPVELGEIEIRLRYHAGGVSADVLADSAAAAQVLQQASGELKRSLEAQGLVVHNLDVRHGEQESRAQEQTRHGGRGHGRAHTNDHSDHTTIDTSRLPLAAGAIDVLA